VERGLARGADSGVNPSTFLVAWICDGEDLREWPLVERKRRLRRLIPSVPTRLLYVDHVQACGKDFFQVACAHDLEGVVAKPSNGRYHRDGTSTWLKIKNPAYTQMTARHDLFQSRTGATLTRGKVPLLVLKGQSGSHSLAPLSSTVGACRLRIPYRKFSISIRSEPWLTTLLYKIVVPSRETERPIG
jgi:hypothetical protein